MKLKDSVVFVTGANRGLGLAFAQAALAAGARKVYAAARDPASVRLAGVVPIALDVGNADQVAAAARDCADVTLLVNNAGISLGASLLASPDAVTAARAEFEVNFFGPWAVASAFAPVLKSHGGGAIVMCCRPSAGSRSPVSRPTARRSRPPGRSPTACATNCAARARRWSPCMSATWTPT